MLLKRKNLVIEINDEAQELIDQKIKEGFNEYKKEDASDGKNNNNKRKNV